MDWDKNGMVNFKEFLFAFTRWVGIGDIEDEEGEENVWTKIFEPLRPSLVMTTETAAPQAVEFLHIINFSNNSHVDINMYNYILIPSLNYKVYSQV